MKAMISTCLATSAALLLAASCDPYSPNLGNTAPFRCGTDDPRCPEGFACVEYSPSQQLCEKEDSAAIPDSGPGQIDSGPFECGRDSQIEPNESITDPTITPIPDFGPEYELVGLQICPDTDIDVFRFRTDVVGKNVTVRLVHNAGAGTLALDILNSGGVSITAGTATANPDVIEASVVNLPVSTYFAQVRSTEAGVENDYDIEIVTSGP